MNYADAPTINEILYNREARNARNSMTALRPNKYRVGQLVRFESDCGTKTGRITNAMCRNGLCTYHIELASGTWYREIEQSQILNIY